MTEDTEDPATTGSGQRAVLGGLALAGACIGGIVWATASPPALSPTALSDAQQVAPVLMATESNTDAPVKANVTENTEGGVDFIVRFSDIPEINHCLRTFRTDPENARTTFKDWARAHPDFADFSLKKANYSGELVLTWDPMGEDLERQDIVEKQEDLQAMDTVKYADPDFTATVHGADQ
ncbi:MAG: hypothetical protein AAGK23_06965 [Pseudomonadota bacterium]